MARPLRGTRCDSSSSEPPDGPYAGLGVDLVLCHQPHLSRAHRGENQELERWPVCATPVAPEGGSDLPVQQRPICTSRYGAAD